MHKTENRWPIGALVPERVIPSSWKGGLGLVVYSDRKIILTSFVASVAHITYKIENRWPVRAFVPAIRIPSPEKGGLG